MFTALVILGALGFGWGYFISSIFPGLPGLLLTLGGGISLGYWLGPVLLRAFS